MSVYPYSSSNYTNAQVVSESAKLRRWHDRLLAFNKGRGFEIEVTDLGADALWVSEEYSSGNLVNGAAKFYTGVPATFPAFSGFVDGVVVANVFRAITLRTSRGITPNHTHTEARSKLKQAGFALTTTKVLPGNGWLALLQAVQEPMPSGISERVIALACPALADSAIKAYFPTLVRFSPALTIAKAPEIIPAPVAAEPAEAAPVVTPVAAAETPEVVETPQTQIHAAPGQRRFLLSGRFERSKSEYAEEIEAAGHLVAAQYDAEVDIVVVPNQNSRTPWVQQAKEDNKLIVVVDDLKSYL